MRRATHPELIAPDPVLEARIREGLDRVERALEEAVRSDTPLVNEAGGYLLAAGGKRFRPTLVLLSSHFADPEDPRIVPAAAATELAHLATLHHDDVIDEAEARRGIPSANARWGNTVAILTGDFLFARASQIASGLGAEATRLLAVTIGKVCEGQIREVQVAGRSDIDEETYRGVIERKTASLIATSARLGGLLSNAPTEVVDGLERVGHALGMAFQLSDDIMDLTADEETLGKSPGVDLKEGVYTLPVILALQDPSSGEELRAVLEQGAVGRVLEIVRSNGHVDLAREAVTREVRTAMQEAEDLPEGTAREALLHLARFLADRCGATV